MSGHEHATIDLGTYRYRPGPAAETAPPAPGRRFRRAAVRQWGLVVCALLMLPLAGAATVPDPELALLLRVAVPAEASAPWVVGGGHLYLGTAASDAGNREWTLTAYRLTDGRVRWRVPLDGSNPPWLQLAGPTLVVGTSGRDGSQATTGYDPASGQPRWTRPENLFQVVSDELVLLSTLPEVPWELIPVDPRTGRDVGGRVRITGDYSAVGTRSGGGADLYTLSRDGAVTRYDLATGDVVASVRTPHRERVDGTIQNWLRVDGELMLAGASGGQAPPATSAYDAETLAHRWDAPAGTGAAQPCGVVVCALRDVGGVAAVHGLDPATGGIRWTVSCDSVPAPADATCRSVAAQPLPSGRLWVTWRWVEVRLVGEPREWTLARVVDAATGRPVSTVSRWDLGSPPQGPGAGPPWWLAAPDHRGQPPGRDGPLLLTRREPAGGGAAVPRVWWARAGTELTDLDVLGTTGAAWSCRPHQPYLVCAGDRELSLWRVASAPAS